MDCDTPHLVTYLENLPKTGEAQGLTRNIKEAIYMKVNDPSLNRNLGKFQLPQVWDQVLKDTPSLQLK